MHLAQPVKTENTHIFAVCWFVYINVMTVR
jgi:hypothetical protein